MARLWIALAMLVIDLVGLGLLVRVRGTWRSLRWRWPTIGVGVIAAAGACLTPHAYGDGYRVVGFPLPGAAFEVSTGHDFVGPLTLPLLCLDVLLVAALPLSLWVIAVVVRARSPASSGRG